MPLNENALISLETAKQWLGISNDNTDHDFKVEMFINSASEKIEKFLNRKLVKKTRTDFHDGNRNTRIMLAHFPVSAVTSVHQSGTWEFVDAIDSDNYTFSEDGALTFKGVLLSRGNSNIKVVYESGFVTPNSPLQTGEALPSSISMACIELVKWLYNIDTDERYGVKSRSKQGQNTSYYMGIPAEITAMIEEYKVMEFESRRSLIDTY